MANDFHTVKIEKLDTSSGSSTMTSIERAEVIEELGPAADSFNFNFMNFNRDLFRGLGVGSRVNIYKSSDGIGSTLLIDGEIQKITQDLDTNGPIISVKGLNRLEKLFNYITPIVAKAGETHTADYWIRWIIREVNQANNVLGSPNDSMYIKGGGNVTDAFIDDLTEWNALGNDVIAAGSEINNYSRNNTIAFELIEELSQPEFAGGIQHIYSLSSDNGLKWIAKPTTIGSTLIEGVDFYSITVDKSLWDTINMIIMNCGTNQFGNTVLAWGIDIVSASKEGIKAKSDTQLSISSKLIEAERTKMEGNGLLNEQYHTMFPRDSGGNAPGSYQPAWDNSVLIDPYSDLKYVGSFTDVVIAEGERKIQDKLRNKSKATFECTIEVPLDSTYVLGDLFKIDSVANQWEGVDRPEMRVFQIQHSFDKGGWKKSIELKEDTDDPLDQ